ncbi:uncharacterized protein TM35_000421090, partial [Trypanosoma theileri]
LVTQHKLQLASIRGKHNIYSTIPTSRVKRELEETYIRLSSGSCKDGLFENDENELLERVASDTRLESIGIPSNRYVNPHKKWVEDTTSGVRYSSSLLQLSDNNNNNNDNNDINNSNRDMMMDDPEVERLDMLLMKVVTKWKSQSRQTAVAPASINDDNNNNINNNDINNSNNNNDINNSNDDIKNNNNDNINNSNNDNINNNNNGTN